VKIYIICKWYPSYYEICSQG